MLRLAKYAASCQALLVDKDEAFGILSIKA
jgi:hypothetical protein